MHQLLSVLSGHRRKYHNPNLDNVYYDGGTFAGLLLLLLRKRDKGGGESLLIFENHNPYFERFQSESVSMALMDLPWYLYSQKNKETLVLMICMAQKPIVLRAAGLVNITLETLMSVSRSS